ncbi:MAG: efflux RND transporter periplasmic adaptor subunit [Candidatus Eiseniibacteriota bacterium]
MNATPPDLTRLRIDRSESERPRAGRGMLPIVIGAAALALIVAVLAWSRMAPSAMDVRVAIAAASGGGSVSGAGISASGYVVARTKASVSAKVPGRLAYLGVSEGSVVRRGQVIARLENEDYRAAVNAADARMKQLEIERDQASRDLERANKLHGQRVLSDAELESQSARLRSLGAQVDAAHAQLEVARASYENTIVLSPFDGTVLRKDAEVGEFVAPSTAGGGLTRSAIATMADLRTLEVEVDVNEAYIARIANGQSCRITLDAYPDTSFAGRVRQVVPTADRQKATVQVKVAILDRDPRILPEMGAKVEFIHRGDGAPAAGGAPRRVLIPRAAIVQGSDGARVWVVADGRATARSVEPGLERGEQVEIRAGLSGGERVVLEAPAGMKDGTRVRVRGS